MNRENMTKQLVSAFSLIVLLMLRPLWAAEGDAEAIGNVSLGRGSIELIRDGVSVPVGGNTLLQEGDRLITASGGLRFRLKDNSRITLASNTEFEITRYRFNAKEKTSDAHFKLLSGAFRAVTGAIGHLPEPSFEVETSVATMGIRGTDFWGGFIFNGDLDVAMFKGKGVYVRNEAGVSDIRLPGEGVTVASGKALGEVKRWPQWKLQRAIESTLLEP